MAKFQKVVFWQRRNPDFPGTDIRYKVWTRSGDAFAGNLHFANKPVMRAVMTAIEKEVHVTHKQ